MIAVIRNLRNRIVRLSQIFSTVNSIKFLFFGKFNQLMSINSLIDVNNLTYVTVFGDFSHPTDHKR